MKPNGRDYQRLVEMASDGAPTPTFGRFIGAAVVAMVFGMGLLALGGLAIYGAMTLVRAW